MGPPEGASTAASPSVPPPAPRAACASCWAQKESERFPGYLVPNVTAAVLQQKRCEYDGGSEACSRCRRMGRVCAPVLPGGRRRRVREWLGGALHTSGNGRRGSDDRRVSPEAAVPSALPWRPSCPGNPPPEVLFACVSAYWDSPHVHSPLIHRHTLERAFLDVGSPMYGEGRRPTALLSAMASNGASTVDLPGWSIAEREALAAMYADNADRLLRKGDASDLEAVQALALLRRRNLTAHHTGGNRSAADRAWDLLRPLLAEGRLPGGFLSRDWEPADSAEWVRGDMLMRVTLFMGMIDLLEVMYGNKAPDLDLYLHGELPLPCSDVVFEMPAEDAFALLSHPGTPLPRAFVDPAPLLVTVPDMEAAQGVVVSLIRALFELRAGRQAFVLLWQLLGHLVCRLRDHPGLCNVDRVALASSDPADDTQDMAAVRAGNAALERLVAGVFEAMPPEFGLPLAVGDPSPFLTSADALLGGLPHALALLSGIVALHAHVIAAWVRGDPGGADAAFFASAPMTSVLASGLAASRLMEAHLALDPTLKWAHRYAYVAVLKVGALSAAVASAAGPETEAGAAAAHDARVAGRYMETYAKVHPAAGAVAFPSVPRPDRSDRINPALVCTASFHDQAFRALLAASGIASGSPPRPAESNAGAEFVEAVALPDLLAMELFGLQLGDGAVGT
ncbi:hypothetical protein DFJ74DRAFT_142351 [Hyaloraphidium curvatum]|nr:hypothetical protein DFJ74DRAFT_142351 [Hyaloraphidium curvatum]